MKSHGENDIIPMVMKILQRRGSVTTSYLVANVPDMLPLTPVDKEILRSRNDARITQIIRNLISHRTLERRGLATYRDGANFITKKGRAYK